MSFRIGQNPPSTPNKGEQELGSSFNFSIITPAHNAEATIGETLESVLAQTYGGWEHVVVDDGSADRTKVIIQDFIKRDSRINLISQTQRGEAAARNTGLARSLYDWLLFLDADDWIASDYLERMLDLLMLQPDVDAVICRSARVASDGTVIKEEELLPQGDLFPILARYPPFHVHACVVRKTVVEAAGGFDSTLHRCPDWDLWQRVARMGSKFLTLDEVLAFYRMSPKGVSLDADKMLRDSLRILRRGHGPDDRVNNPDPRFVQGMPAAEIVTQEFYLLSWCAGLLLGAGRDARPLLKMVEGDHFSGLWPASVLDCILEAAVLPSCKPPQRWPQLIPTLSENLKAFLLALEEHSGTPDLAERTIAELSLRLNMLSASPLSDALCAIAP